MDGSSDSACVKADLKLLLRSVKAVYLEGFSKGSSDIGKGWFLLYSVFRKWWWRRCPVRSFFKSSAYNSVLTNCPPCTIQNLDLSSVRVDTTMHHSYVGVCNKEGCDMLTFSPAELGTFLIKVTVLVTNVPCIS